MPPKPDLSFSGLEEFVNEPTVSEPIVKKPVVESSQAKDSEAKPKIVRKSNVAPLIEDWVSDSEEEDVPQAKIQKKTVKPINTAQPKTTVNSARPMTNVFNKAHSTVRRPINNKSTTKNSNFSQKVNTARPKVVLNAVKGNQVNAVKASACWVWKAKQKGNVGKIDCNRLNTGSIIVKSGSYS
ncbi:hypothetical protein Tco_0422664 [Tanacetum coccineum]